MGQATYVDCLRRFEMFNRVHYQPLAAVENPAIRLAQEQQDFVSRMTRSLVERPRVFADNRSVLVSRGISPGTLTRAHEQHELSLRSLRKSLTPGWPREQLTAQHRIFEAALSSMLLEAAGRNADMVRLAVRIAIAEPDHAAEEGQLSSWTELASRVRALPKTEQRELQALAMFTILSFVDLLGALRSRDLGHIAFKLLQFAASGRMLAARLGQLTSD
jgi:hypothetical protein